MLGGRSKRAVGLLGDGAGYPKKSCLACNCRHAGLVRCYLSDAEDELYLSVFIRPFGSTFKNALLQKKKAKEGEALGFVAADALDLEEGG